MLEPDDLAIFCEHTYPRLVGALDLYLGDVHVAEELAQEALIRATKRWSRVRELDSPGGWTYRVALNLAASWFRRKRAEARAYAKVEGSPEALLDVDSDVAYRQVVRDAVRVLPEGQRAVLVFRYYLGLSGPETAEAMGISHGAVRARLKRAVSTLRDQLGPVTDDLEEGADAI